MRAGFEYFKSFEQDAQDSRRENAVFSNPPVNMVMPRPI
jgi:hypothetical protein